MSLDKKLQPQIYLIEKGTGLKVYAVQALMQQKLEQMHASDAWFSLQQGHLRLSLSGKSLILQSREGYFIPAKTAYILTFLSDCRGRIVLPNSEIILN